MKYKTRSVEEIQKELKNRTDHMVAGSTDDNLVGFILALRWVLIPDEEEEIAQTPSPSSSYSYFGSPSASGQQFMKNEKESTKQGPIEELPNPTNNETRLIAQTCLKKINELVRAVNEMRKD